MKMKQLIYLTIILGLLLPMSALPVAADAEDDPIPMWIQRARLTWTGRSSGGPDAMVGYIHIRDITNDMVEGALVDAVWTWTPRDPEADPVKTEAQVETNGQGIAEFRLWMGGGEYELCVTDVTKVDSDVGLEWKYDEELNFDTVNNNTDCPVFAVP